MKTLLMAATAVFLAVGCVFAADQPSFPADITHGNIRCVLMSVGQTRVFPNDQDRAKEIPARPGGSQGVPCFTVTFLMESLADAPKDAPNELLTLKGLTVLSEGKPIHIGGGEYQQWIDYDAFRIFLDFSKPKVTNPKRAVIMRFVRFGFISNPQPLSLVIETGFGKDIQRFQFDSIHIQ
jgi:hypothetical protein